MSEEVDEPLDPLTVSQLREEEKIISSHKICTIHPEHLDIDKLRDDLLKMKLDTEFYDANTLGVIFCLFDTITHIPSDDKHAYTEVVEYLKALFTSLRRIGAESRNGNALLVSIKSTEGVLIAKSPKSKLNDELFHEYFVGVMALNKLRRVTPNFAYILGAFKCLPPEIAEDKRVTSWCEAQGINKNNLVNYVLYEKIPGQSVEDLIPTCTAEEFFSWFVQIAISLHLARNSFFTHYDLHTGNVMARKWKDDDSISIPYEVQPNLTWYVKAGTVAQIIDYGMSHIVVNGKHFGKRGIEHAGVHQNLYRPMFDLYKFLGFGLVQMLDAGNPAASQLIPVWRLLNAELLDVQVPSDPDKLKRVLMEQVDTYFALSSEPLDIEAEYSVWDFIKAMRSDPQVNNMWKKIVTSEADDEEVLTCGDTCPVPVQIMRELTGDANEEVQESLTNVRFGSPSDKSGALAAMPSQIIALRKQMSTLRAQLLKDMQRCNGMSFGKTPMALDTPQFQDFISDYVEPFLSVRTQLLRYESMRNTLCEYYNLKGNKCSTNEFDFGDEYDRWMTNLQVLTSKVDRFTVTNKSARMRDHLLTML
jgi:hypothetical protein